MMRAMTLLELMIVVAIVGILATIAVPNLTSMARQYRAAEAARSALAATTAARGLSQRENAPVQLQVLPDHVTLGTATFSPATAPAEVVRKVIDSFTPARDIFIQGNGKFVRLDLLDAAGTVLSSTPAGPLAVLRFCASSDGYHHLAGGGEPTACPAGSLASSDADIVFTAGDDTYHLRVRAALGTIDLKRGS
jgi:prepilin-type N-terminal cleavage/methylation domain-containing protein